MNPWDADIHLSLESAHELVREQFPEFGQENFQLLSSGWDNDAYLADDKVVFRFPRRVVAAKLIENEIRILPLLAPSLPLPISVSRLIGKPTEKYPFVWAGYDYVEGSTACRMEWTDDQRAANARPLGEFLRALHAIPVSDEMRSWAPGDEIGRTDFMTRLPKVMERLEVVRRVLPKVDVDRIGVLAQELARSAIRDPRSEICWVHGDLYSRHIIANPDHRITAVIDWGDVHLGDRALDLSIAFTFLPYSAHDEFREAYGEIDDVDWQAACFRAISHAAAITDYGVGINDDDLLKAAGFTLLSIQSNN